jgi:2-hydroxy-3-oxopropionate reductase
MGGPMARRLVEHGFDVTVNDRVPEAVAELTALGASRCEELSALAHVDAVLAMVPAAVVESLMLGPGGVLEHVAPGTLVIDGGNSDPAVSRRIAAAVAERGVAYLDVGFSGGPSKATDGTLAVMAGGDAADYARAEPLFRALGGELAHVGPSGAGHLAKALNHLVVGLTSQAIGEALAIAAANGLDPARWIDVARSGAAGSWLMDRARQMVALDEHPGMDAWWGGLGGRTQLTYSMEAADAGAVAVPLTALGHELRKLSLEEHRAPALEQYVRLTWTFANVTADD